MELRGFEPLTFCMPCRRATSCAIAPQPNRTPFRAAPQGGTQLAYRLRSHVSYSIATTPRHHDDTTAPPRRHSDATVLPARRFPMIAGRPPTSINPPSAVTLLPDPHLAAAAGKLRARTVGLTYHGTPADPSRDFNV